MNPESRLVLRAVRTTLVPFFPLSVTTTWVLTGDIQQYGMLLQKLWKVTWQIKFVLRWAKAISQTHFDKASHSPTVPEEGTED